jgi:hypothetical protein
VLPPPTFVMVRAARIWVSVSGAAVLVAMLTFQVYSQTLPLGGNNAHLERPEIGFFCAQAMSSR